MAAAVVGLFVLGGCSNQPRTDRELTARAQEAVDRKLGAQAQFSLMESVVARQIACGHAVAAGKPEQDFVYRDGKVILDNDPDFDTAAVECDAAVGGGTAPTDDNSAS